jgi:hypothetical protein
MYTPRRFQFSAFIFVALMGAASVASAEEGVDPYSRFNYGIDNPRLETETWTTHDPEKDTVIIDVPLPPRPSSAPPPGSSSTPAAVPLAPGQPGAAIAVPDQPCAGSSSSSSGGSSPGMSAAQKRAAAQARMQAAAAARQASQDRARQKLGYGDVQPIEGGDSGNAPIRGTDFGALDDQIRRLGAMKSQAKDLDLDTINIEFGDQVGGDMSGGDKFGWQPGVGYHFDDDSIGDDSMDDPLLGANFALGPGVSLLGTVSWVDWNDEDEAPTVNNDGWAVLGGINVSF